MRHYNASVWIMDLVSNTTYIGCVNFKHQRRDLQFKNDSDDRLLPEKLFMTILFTFRYLLRGSRLRNIFIYSFGCLIWDSHRDLTSNKPTQYILNDGNFNILFILPLFVANLKAS